MSFFNEQRFLNRLDQPHDIFEVILYDANVMGAAGTLSTQEWNPGYKGINITINLTALVGGTPQIYWALYGAAINYDGTNAYEWPLLTSPIHSATGFQVLKIHPAITPIPNGAATDLLPPSWKFYTVLSGTGVTATFTVHAVYER